MYGHFVSNRLINPFVFGIYPSAMLGHKFHIKGVKKVCSALHHTILII